MKDKTLNENDLKQFTGTEVWYQHPLFRLVKFTEGVKYVADTGGAYWLIDEIAGAQYTPRVRKEEFQVWKLKVSDSRAVLICKDGHEHSQLVYRKKINFTDFPLPEITFWCIDGVILLPSEY